MNKMKSIPGTVGWKISLSGNFEIDGQACTPKIVDGKVEIVMFGIKHNLDVGWLALLAQFEVNTVDIEPKDIFRMTFTDWNLRNRLGKMRKTIIFAKPILVNGKYRVIPGFTQYAISKLGEIIQLGKLSVLKVYEIEENKYPLVTMYDPWYNKTRTIRLHQMVALAWLKNNDFMGKPIVNHKNGKTNQYQVSNLEWSSYLENNIHAINSGLRNDNNQCKVRDFNTNIVTEFHSVRQAAGFMGLPIDAPMKSLRFRNPSKLIRNQFEFRLRNDTSPWFYNKNDVKRESGRYTLHITHPNGRKQICPDVRGFIREFKVWNVSNISCIVAKALKLYPGISIRIEDHYILKPVQAYRFEDGKVFEMETIRGLCKLLKLNYSSVNARLNAKNICEYKGYGFRYKSEEPWDTNFTVTLQRGQCIVARSCISKDVLRFKSLRVAAKHFNLDRSSIKTRIKNGKHIQNYKLSEE